MVLSVPFQPVQNTKSVIAEMEGVLARLRERDSSIVPLKSNLARAQHLYKSRRMREVVFEEVSDLFHDPVWDILIDLYINESTLRLVSIKSACSGSNTPSTTGLRALKILEQRGYVRFRQDDLDKRRRFVELTDLANARMGAFLAFEEHVEEQTA